ncbi:MAG: phosphate ABC transporter ATP-binding protein PstB [Deltaproteobacteria bacterium]|nr:phosphate ABC transporter ATP-binding protein PstB [Deltaproteobacteria bacterium]
MGRGLPHNRACIDRYRVGAAHSGPEERRINKLTIKNLNFYYGQKQALKNVNLHVRENEITALIGPSGCGKTTFLRCLNRMHDLYPGNRYEGEILLDGVNILEKKLDLIKLRSRVGMVFQKPTPFPMTIFDNIAFGLKLAGVRNKGELAGKVQAALKVSALWEETKDRLGDSALSLSGGQQQRLCIARAVAVEPDVILMDEPCSALDPVATAKIEDLMSDLKRNYTVVIVTHNMQQAARVSEHTGFFMLGEVIEFDQTQKIFTAPSNKLTEDYITGRFG